MRSVLDEIVGPNVIAMLGPQPDARSVVEPQPPTLRLPLGNLQPLASPDPFDPLVIDRPAGLLQQPGDLAIAVAAVLPGKCDGVGGEPFLIIPAPRDLALCRAVLPKRRASATLGDMQFMSDLLDTGTATRGA